MPLAFRFRECFLTYRDGDSLVHVFINPSMVAHWREIAAGVRHDVVTWQAAAASADRIDVVAQRVAADHVRPLAEERLRFPVWRELDRIMVAAIGWEWALRSEFRVGIHTGCVSRPSPADEAD